MPLVTVTKRQIKNENTGTDITVPSYQPAGSPRNVKDYHVVVISRLPHFKQPEHSEEDVVQFMVPRDYASFDKLQKNLLEQFSNLKLPDLPRKHILFMSDEDIEDRRFSFDCLMTLVSRSTELVTSIPMLEFLGVDLLADRKYKKHRQKYLEQNRPSAKKKNNKIESEEDLDLFGEATKTESDFDELGNNSKPSMLSDDIFSTQEVASSKVKLTLLEDDSDINPQVVTAEERVESNTLFEIEDNSDILNVMDDLNDVLKITKGKSNQKKSVSKPLVSSLFDDDDTTTEHSAMGTDDITKYIQQNQSNDDDLELF